MGWLNLDGRQHHAATHHLPAPTPVHNFNTCAAGAPWSCLQHQRAWQTWWPHPWTLQETQATPLHRARLLQQQPMLQRV